VKITKVPVVTPVFRQLNLLFDAKCLAKRTPMTVQSMEALARRVAKPSHY